MLEGLLARTMLNMSNFWMAKKALYYPPQWPSLEFDCIKESQSVF